MRWTHFIEIVAIDMSIPVAETSDVDFDLDGVLW